MPFCARFATNGQLRCTGVQVRTPSGMVTVRVKADVILSAGSIGSPQVLQLSGIGLAALLQQPGVPVLHDAPGVGTNLQDHLQIRTVDKVQGVKTLNVQPLSLEAFGEPLHRFATFTASVCNLHPSSRGSVQIRSPDFSVATSIAPNDLSTEADCQVAADSLRLTRTIVAQPAQANFQPQEFKPGGQYQSDADLARLAGDIATTIFHSGGRTKIGRADDPLAVLDSHLRVRGPGGLIAGLRVVDAGAMPVITSSNTNSPTLMMAEKAARWIAAGM